MNPYQPPQAYLPHRSPMLLLESVIAITDDSAHCQTGVNTGGVLAPFLSAKGELPAWYGVELMAQTIGVWSGWHQLQGGENGIALGLLLGVREYHCPYPVFPAAALLDIKISLLIRDTQFGSFEAEILYADQRLAQGRINTYQPDRVALQQLFTQQTNQEITS